jgi:DNA processing protein
MNEDLLLHHIALTRIPQIGDIHIGILLKHFSTPADIFNASKKELENISGFGSIRANQIKQFRDFDQIKREIEFVEKNHIQVLVKGFSAYPHRLEHCIDSPHILYYKGNANLNVDKIISIVGTRTPTEYGKERVAELIANLLSHEVLVISGLAYGIDTMVHKEAVKNKLSTVAVLGHGFEFLYPYANRELAESMVKNGGLLTEFTYSTKPDKQNFPRRNRIVAGMSDAVIVIESSERGGSLITADIGNSYNKDVLAYPGRAHDLHSSGCNQLIRQHKANLITCGKDLVEFMNWTPQNIPKKVIQPELFVVLENEEKIIYEIIREKEPVSIDEISYAASMKPSTIAAVILSLEMKNLVIPFPGKLFKTTR